MESNVCPKCGKVMTVVVCGAVGSDLMAVCECGHNHERVGIDYAYAATAEVAVLRRALDAIEDIADRQDDIVNGGDEYNWRECMAAVQVAARSIIEECDAARADAGEGKGE